MAHSDHWLPKLDNVDVVGQLAELRLLELHASADLVGNPKDVQHDAEGVDVQAHQLQQLEVDHAGVPMEWRRRQSRCLTHCVLGQ